MKDIIDELAHIVSRVFGISGGLGLIGLAIMWFGVVPMVACMFGHITSMMMFGMFILMVIVIVLIIRFIMMSR